jgi:hypothetical protein
MEPGGKTENPLQPTVKLSVGRLELVPDLGLGLTGDLAPDPLAVLSEADRDRPDETVLRRVEVDRALAIAATAPPADSVCERRTGCGSV